MCKHEPRSYYALKHNPNTLMRTLGRTLTTMPRSYRTPTPPTPPPSPPLIDPPPTWDTPQMDSLLGLWWTQYTQTANLWATLYNQGENPAKNPEWKEARHQQEMLGAEIKRLVFAELATHPPAIPPPSQAWAPAQISAA